MGSDVLECQCTATAASDDMQCLGAMEKPLPDLPRDAKAEVDGWLRALGNGVLQEAIPQRLLDALGVRNEVGSEAQRADPQQAGGRRLEGVTDRSGSAAVSPPAP